MKEGKEGIGSGGDVVRCRLCDGGRLRPYYRQGNAGQFVFYKCRDCGLVNLDLAGLNVTEHQEKYATEYPDPDDPHINRGSFASWRFLRKHLRTPGSFLDVGCGNGALLKSAREEGWTVKGLELSPFLAEQVRERLGIEVEAADFLEYDLPGERFDLVSLRHVLEHLPDSKKAMGKINHLLKPGGYALLEFPNIEGISFRTRRGLEKAGLHRKRYPADYRPGHCNEFSRKSFARLAGQTGFRVVVWETYGYSPIKNFLYNRIPVGTKARVLVRKSAADV